MNGKYYPVRWGGNQHAGGRSVAFGFASAYRVDRRVAFDGNLIVGSVQIYRGCEVKGEESAIMPYVRG